MTDHGKDIVLLVCDDEAHSLHLLDRLNNSGFGVLGPVTNAAMALTVAAQSSPTVAVVASSAGEPGAPALADSLMRTWGVRSLLLAETGAEAFEDAEWAARPAERARLHRALGLEPTL